MKTDEDKKCECECGAGCGTMIVFMIVVVFGLWWAKGLVDYFWDKSPFGSNVNIKTTYRIEGAWRLQSQSEGRHVFVHEKSGIRVTVVKEFLTIEKSSKQEPLNEQVSNHQQAVNGMGCGKP